MQIRDTSPAAIGRFGLPSFGLRRPFWRDVWLILMSVTVVGVVYWATAESSALATAVVVATSTAAGMHARLAIGRWLAAVQIVLAALLLPLVGAPPRLVGLLLVAGLVGAELVARCARRSAILRVAAGVSAVAGIVSVSGLVAAVALPARVSFAETIASAVGGFLSAPLMLMFAPLAEWTFGHVTRLTMSEWLNYEHPLLRRLASSAPGTFQHSVNVGVLADAAAGAIGADPLLARVGALYHDVGKMNAPAYFIENQHGANPHDSLDPIRSAEILRAHVVDGVGLVRQHRMGERVANFVREHHGTGEMRLLKSNAETRGAVTTPETFRYPGPRPQSRETGIVMIADQLEAAARSNPPADDTVSATLVRTTISRIQSQGQLEDAGLTPVDLERAQHGFLRALQAMYHRRLTYPSSDPGPSRPLVGSVAPRQGAP